MKGIGRGKGWKVVCAALVTVFALGFAGSASATLTGNYTVFTQCPRDTGAKRCLYSETTGGEVNIGGKALKTVNTSVLQAGYIEGEEGELLPIFPAANGETLSKAPQPIPGGLLAVMPAKTSPIWKALFQSFANSPLNRLSQTMEIAGPASSVKISASHLAEGFGTAIELPAKIHLENPLLGKNCYIGSNSTPITLELTDGTTSPPPPNLPIQGYGGGIEFLEGGAILVARDSELVDNAFSVPKAHGCGPLMDPLINKQLGLPSPAGRNTAILKATARISPIAALIASEEENP